MAAYDRYAEDLGNITMLEHVNLQIPDQALGTLFYIQGLGLTRDPYMNTGLANMWINVGKSQFHLPTGEPWVLRGAIALVTPDRDSLLQRLESVKKPLAGTKFAVNETNDCVEVTCPWGNRMRVHAPDADRFGRMALGMPYIEFDVRPGTVDGIARFYSEVMLATSKVISDAHGRRAKVEVGEKQFYYFREIDRPIPAYDGHHVQIFITNFSGPYRRLVELGLLTVEFGQHEYRFNDVIDLDTRQVLFTMEHEVRSHTHPMYGRPLINRNPAQNNRDYKPGHDSIAWALP